MTGQCLARRPSSGTPAVEGWAPTCVPETNSVPGTPAQATSGSSSSLSSSLIGCIWVLALSGLGPTCPWSCQSPWLMPSQRDRLSCFLYFRGCPAFVADGGPAEPSRIGSQPPCVSWVSYVTKQLISGLWEHPGLLQGCPELRGWIIDCSGDLGGEGELDSALLLCDPGHIPSLLAASKALAVRFRVGTYPRKE